MSFQSIVGKDYTSLTKSQRKVVDYILENIETAARMTIQDISEATNVSIATISRLTKKLGYGSFQDMKLKIYENTQNTTIKFFPFINKDDSYCDIASNSFYMGKLSLKETQLMLQEETLVKAIEILANAKTCNIFALGASQVVALDAFHRFMRTSLKCSFLQDFHFQLMHVASLTNQDCALIISHTGRNKDSLEIAKIAKKNGVPIISITSNMTSPLTKLSDIVLVSVSDETNYRPEAVSSLVSQITLVDALFMMYAIKIDDNEEYFTKIRNVINTTRIDN
ncbi:RpiR family transcriptional regulator [Alkalibaculum bacchi]|uniref:RpiR family transcriptional regulator n=1 Tax=Alkalibaculum bacchi TaxID=645887 RepID=A0A366IAP8_9FIRM|nr:MurR/RpiR family transcriptional regulator [Alkalibaculum bacchi]RBP67320.1 RpiR family transcriptional regulator [Alkalibaculum bacchi]